jgi:hypothetical protein
LIFPSFASEEYGTSQCNFQMLLLFIKDVMTGGQIEIVDSNIPVSVETI